MNPAGVEIEVHFEGTIWMKELQDLVKNKIFKISKDKIKEDDIEFLDEFMQDIDSWRVCLDEIDLSIKKHLNTEKQNEYKIDKVKKEIIIY